jgi:hypothetical protein
MRHKILAILLAMFFIVAVLGCGGYYMVKDPASGNVYYTTKIKDEKGGAIKFEDKKTQTNVTLQNSEIKQIPKKEFKSALEAKEAPETKEAAEMKEAPESKPVK